MNVILIEIKSVNSLRPFWYSLQNFVYVCISHHRVDWFNSLILNKIEITVQVFCFCNTIQINMKTDSFLIDSGWNDMT